MIAVVVVGCQQTTTARLEGTWRGVPDSRSAQLAREKEREKSTAKQPADGQSLAADIEEQAETKPAPPSDLESLDFAILIEFAARGKVTMQLVGEATSLAGTWQIIETRPNGALVEITRLRRTPDDEQEKRRFEITFEGEQKSAGFRLKESGADPRFGLLYFSPVDLQLPEPPDVTDEKQEDQSE